MQPRLSGYSSDSGENIILTVGNVPLVASEVQVWGGKRGQDPVLLDTLSPPYGDEVIVSTESGVVYSFIAISVDGSSLSLSEIVNIYAKLQELDIGIIDEVAAYMEEAGLGVVGQDIFKFTFPQTQNELYLLIPTGGLPPDVACGQEAASFSIQYRSLENRPQVGYHKLLRAKQVLHAAGNVLATIKGIIEAQQAEPVYLGVDGRNKMNVHTLPFRFRGPKR